MKLLLLWTILALAAITSAKNTYIAVVPRAIRPGMPTRVSVNILPSTSDVTVVTSLRRRASDVALSSVSDTVRSGQPAELLLPVPSSLTAGQYVIRVIGSGGVSFTNQIDVTFLPKSFSIFIQTDKAMYKPSQKVLLRALAITPDMRPTSSPMDIEIYDPNSNKIKQWLGATDASGVVSLSLELADQPVQGDWKIKVTCQNAIEEKTFTVKEYVLPKFSVEVQIPSYVVNTEQTIAGTVKAEYTYGQPVRGVAILRIVRENGRYNTLVQKRIDINGESSFVFRNTDVERMLSGPGTYRPGSMMQTYNNLKIRVEANVTETLTGKELTGEAVITIVRHPAKLKFTNSSPKHMKPGMKYLGYLKVTQADGRPVVGMTGDVTLSGTYEYYMNTDSDISTTPLRYPRYNWYQPRRPTVSGNLSDVTLSVPQDGVVSIEMNVPINAETMSLTASYAGAHTQSISLKKMQSPSHSYLQLTPRGTQFRAGETALIDVKSSIPMTQLFYTVMSRGTIITSNVLVYSSITRRTRSVLRISLTSQMAPSAKVVAYYVNDNARYEIVSESVSIPVDGLFENQVSLSFSTARREPGESVDLTVNADPQSKVNILTVDQSVLLLASGNDITAQQVLEEMSSYDAQDQSNGYNRGGWWSSYSIDGDSAGGVFENAGVNVMTDAFLYHYIDTQILLFHTVRHFPMRHTNRGSKFAIALATRRPEIAVPPGNLAPVERVRNVFPETWLWTETLVGTNGSVTIQTTAPDTITSWVASAFAVNSVTGLGVSPSTAKLEVFRPFFVSLNLPYSVIRGEELVIQAIVFNYLATDMQVVVTLAGGVDFMSILVNDRGNMGTTSGDQVETIQVPAGEGKSIYFPIIPNRLGSVSIEVSAQSTMAADALRRQLLVEAEGDPREYTQSVLLDLTGNNSQTASFPITLPQGVVSGSERVTISAIGDLMGSTINNLDQLLRMPSGCGEQTMIGFAPDVYVLDYLTVTNQLTVEIQTKALSFLEKGYQRELTYQHTEGAFSAFGNRDEHGSTWLTSFVIRSFRQAKPYTFIDDAVLEKATNWLLRQQHTNGSFAEPGHLHHRGLQGGVSSQAALSAYVLVSLLEGNTHVTRAVRSVSRRATSYLEGQLQQMTEPYSLALTTYALTLSGSSRASYAQRKLEALAIVTAGMKHWESPSTTQPTQSPYWRRPNNAKALDIELAAYALLIYAHNQNFTGGLLIVKWLVEQRNAHGGFSSTQDTVVGLQSMSQVARSVYSDSFNVDVRVTSGNSISNFNINEANALVFQTEELSSIPSNVTVLATGQGMAMVGVTVNYNVESEPEEPSFNLTTQLLHETLNVLTVEVCTRWLHPGSSGMSVMEIGIPTAFAADEESIERPAFLKRVEMASRKVVLYFDSIDGSFLCLSVTMERVGMAAKSQPVPVKIYDYYEPDNQVTTFYQSQLLRDSSVCDVCGSDCGC